MHGFILMANGTMLEMMAKWNMVFLVGDKHKRERYLLDDNGAMVINQYWDQFGSSNYIDTNGLVHLPDVYYQMMPN